MSFVSNPLADSVTILGYAHTFGDTGEIDALVFEAANPNGIRIDLDAAPDLAVSSGDGSDYAPIHAKQMYVGGTNRATSALITTDVYGLAIKVPPETGFPQNGFITFGGAFCNTGAEGSENNDMMFSWWHLGPNVRNDGKYSWSSTNNAETGAPDLYLERADTGTLLISDGGDGVADGKLSLASITLGGLKIIAGAGTPEASVTAPSGSLYLRSDGGANTSLYIKESGVGNLGWVAK